MDEQSPESAPLEFERNEEFVSLYANNVMFRMTLFDLKMIFGQVDQREGNAVSVEQHTAITIPWIQAKLMIYFLQVNVAVFEAEHGKIKIPNRLMPPEPEVLPGAPDNVADVQLGIIRKLHQEFLANLK
jgi:hypothetical protein